MRYYEKKFSLVKILNNRARSENKDFQISGAQSKILPFVLGWEIFWFYCQKWPKSPSKKGCIENFHCLAWQNGYWVMFWYIDIGFILGVQTYRFSGKSSRAICSYNNVLASTLWNDINIQVMMLTKMVIL